MKIENMEVHRLRAENDTLREQVRQMRAQLVDGGHRAPLSWGLTDLERRLYAHMTSRDLVTRESAMVTLYGHLDAPPDPKIIDIWIHKLRRKLAPHGIRIKTHWGVGWAVQEPAADRRADKMVSA